MNRPDASAEPHGRPAPLPRQLDSCVFPLPIASGPLEFDEMQLLSGAKVAILDRFDQVQQMIDLLPAPLHDAHVQAYRDHLANR